MPQNKGSKRGRKQRRPRDIRRILIICEDTKSSKDYFECFPYNHEQVEIQCVGTGMNTDSLMENAVERAKNARDSGTPYERVWVVFDRDSFPLDNFNRAFELAKKHPEIEPCWANECFELWYLLHFNYRDTGINRAELQDEISKLLGFKYEKFDPSIFKHLRSRIHTAIANGKRLSHSNDTSGETRRNPSTKIHELVDALLKLDPELPAMDSTAVLKAIRDADFSILKELADHLPDFPSGSDESGRHWLAHAISCGNAQIVNWMLRYGATPTIMPDDGYTLLHIAIECTRPDKYQIMRQLIAEGADANAIGIHGYAPAHFAAVRNDVKALKVLDECGADFTIQTSVDNYHTPLEAARSFNEPRPVEAINYLESLDSK